MMGFELCGVFVRIADEEISLEATEQPIERRGNETYLMPSMNFDEAKHDALLKEAADMDLVLQGKKVTSNSGMLNVCFMPLAGIWICLAVLEHAILVGQSPSLWET